MSNASSQSTKCFHFLSLFKPGFIFFSILALLLLLADVRHNTIDSLENVVFEK